MLLSWNILRNVLSLLLKEERVAWCLGENCSRCGGQSVKKCESHGFCGWSVGVWACVCLTKSGESRKDCKGAVAQKDKREWNLWLHCNTYMQFCILFIKNLGASGVAVGEVCSFDGMVLWEWDVQQYFGLYASVELQSWECPWEENCNSLIWKIHRKLPVVFHYKVFARHVLSITQNQICDPLPQNQS